MKKNKAKTEALLNTKTFDELLDVQYGKIGTPKRDAFEHAAENFIVAELIKEARREANMTQEQLAEKTGLKTSYISRVENGQDIRVSSLRKILEKGFGKRLSLHIA